MRGFFRSGTQGVRMQGNLPPEAREKIETLQDIQERAQQVTMQKQQAEAELANAQHALEALEDIDPEARLYREVGELMIETEYDDAKESLGERVDNLEIRVQTLEKQEDRVREQFESLQTELQSLLQQAGIGGGLGGPGAGGA